MLECFLSLYFQHESFLTFVFVFKLYKKKTCDVYPNQSVETRNQINLSALFNIFIPNDSKSAFYVDAKR